MRLSLSRKLASVRKVRKLEPIEGADRIELAHIDGWQCVVKKGEFQEGSLGIYFEIDSRLPEAPWSEFLRPRKFKVKTVKMRGVLSQGLFLSIDSCELGGKPWPSDGDVTKQLGVTKIQLDDEPPVSRDATPWYFFLIPKKLRTQRKWGFPEFIPKTDETRVQNIKNLPKILEGRHLYATEKLDGQSVTMFYHRKLWSFNSILPKRGTFGVCSRNVYYGRPQNNNWWNAARKYEIQRRLEEYCKKYKVSLAIQGEIVGTGIQGNKYELSGDPWLFVFSIWDIEKQRYLRDDEKGLVCVALGLQQVPYIGPVKVLPGQGACKSFLQYAEMNSYIGSRPEAEGIVIRDILDDSFSFKAISNRWLLEYDKG